jgi:YggT family protein
MSTLIDSLGIAIGVLRVVFLVVAGVAVAVCVIDWAVRTRRINPFTGIARFFRRSIDPLLAPIERRVVRGGGLPSTAPWWGLGAVVIGGILVLVALDFLRGQLAVLAVAMSLGGRGIARVLVSWAVGVFQLALIVRVILSWVSVSPSSRWVRWAYTLTEPLLRPLRRVVPPIGIIDITPIVAYFLVWIVSGFVLSAL